MKQLYYGLWHSFYNLSWPFRFLVEITLALILIWLISKLIRKIVQIFRLEAFFIKGWVWAVTEFIYLIGRNREWAVEAEGKVIEWGKESLEQTEKRKHPGLKKVAVSGIIIIYFLAIFVDLPFSQHLSEYYFIGLGNFKQFVQQYEKIISRGYEEYPPLFVKKEVEEERMEETDIQEKIPITVRLNEWGKNGANVRGEPSLDGEIIGGVNGESEIVYQEEWKEDGKRCWIRIYLPNDGIEGWLSGNLVDEQQLEMITNDG